MPKTTSVPVRQDTRPEARDVGLTPWSRLGTFRDEIDRLFGSFEPRQWFDRPLAMLSAADALVPAMDLTENGSSYQVSMELPGIDPAKVEVKLTNGTLTVSGEKEEESKEEGEDYHVSERRWGSFRRTVAIPDHVDRNKIEASHANGVLIIKLPKTAEAKAAERTIKVKAG
jgi:HSP20 family protein